MDSAPPVDLDDLLENEPDELTPPDVARIRGWNRVRAWRWLSRLHHEHGEKIVRKRGRALVVSRRNLAMLIEGAHGPIDPRIIVRMNELERRIIDQEKRGDAHAAALSKLHAI